MTELSPQAQAVFSAWTKPVGVDRSLVINGQALELQARGALAAALLAAAEQVLAVQWEGRIEPDTAHSLGINWTRDALHAIAAELEAAE